MRSHAIDISMRSHTSECDRIELRARPRIAARMRRRRLAPVSTNKHEAIMAFLFIPLALAAGALLAVQAGANAQLSKAIGSPIAATTLQLSIGALLLLLLTLLSGTVLTLSLL